MDIYWWLFDRFLTLNEDDRKLPLCNQLFFRKDLTSLREELAKFCETSHSRSDTRAAREAFQKIERLNRDWTSISQIYQVKRIEQS